MRARSWAQPTRVDREGGVAARVVLGAVRQEGRGGARGWAGGSGAGHDPASTAISSGPGRPMETTVDLRRALGARTPW